MSLAVPRFPHTPIEEWDDLTLMAANVYCEAEGEPNDGKVAVAWVVRNRADKWDQHVHNVILAPYQFSWLNADYRNQAIARLASAVGDEVEQCWRAAAAGLWRLLPDPTNGCCFYLNVELTKKIRGGTLPSWFNPDKVRVVLGHHTFLV